MVVDLELDTDQRALCEEVRDWLREGDITHVSNEVAFDPECGPPNPVQEGLLFCSDPRYIELLEDIGVDVVEMTGNHIADAGVEHIEPTLEMYVERGWQYFGGGRNLEDARQPAIFQHNGNAIAFLGCNPTGPASVWATPERAGAGERRLGPRYSRSRGKSPFAVRMAYGLRQLSPPQAPSDPRRQTEPNPITGSRHPAIRANKLLAQNEVQVARKQLIVQVRNLVQYAILKVGEEPVDT